MIRYLNADRAGTFANYIGQGAVLALGLCAWLSTAGVNVAFAALLLAFLLDPKAVQACARDPLFALAAAFAVYALLGAWAGAAEFPDNRAHQFRDMQNWIKPLAFWPVAWFARGDPARIHRLLLLAVCSLLLGMLSHCDPAELLHFRLPARTGFQLKIIFGGLVSGSALLGLLAFAPRIWRAGPWRLLRIALWWVALYLSGYMLLAGYSRGAWLAFAIALIFTASLGFFALQAEWRKPAAAFGALLAAVMLVFVSLNLDRIGARFAEERETFEAILRGDFEHLPRTSVGFRLDVQLFGLQRWLERPWLGWGPGATEYLIAHSDNPRLLHPSKDGALDWMDHVHNSYLEVLLRFGLVGAGLLGAAGVFLIGGLIQAYRAGRVPLDCFLFSLGCLLMTAVWSFFDFRLLHGDWRAYWLILAGVAHSFRLAQADAERAP
jgi:O-antigen ligase